MPEELKQMSTVGHTYTTYTTRHVKHGGTHDFEKKSNQNVPILFTYKVLTLCYVECGGTQDFKKNTNQTVPSYITYKVLTLCYVECGGTHDYEKKFESESTNKMYAQLRNRL